MRLKEYSFIFIMVFIPALLTAQTRPVTPVQVGGTYSKEDAPEGSAAAKTADIDAELTNLSNLIKIKSYDAAVRKVNNLVADGKESPRFSLILAQAYEGLGRWEDCVYHASDVIAVGPMDSRGYSIRANCYYKKGDLEKAKIDIDKAYAINPNSAKLIELKKFIEDAARPKPAVKTASPSPAPAAAAPAARPAQTVKTAAPVTQEKLENIRWWIIYFIVVLAIVCVYIYFKYTPPGKSSSGPAKKLDIKEQYNFIRQIGEGGMGKVYEAYDKALKRRVAVKRVKPELVRSNYVREQFLSEARTVALLRHPNIVEIYTVIESDNSLYLVFEYVDGQTLETRLDIDGFVPFSEAKNIFECVCRGLHYAHAQDIIHCDLKPGNIMITEAGVAKVMDFGVAKKVVEGDNGARTVAGTPAYMAPEQQKGFMRKQSDVYSLGVCLYEALVGQVPWSVAGFDIANKLIVPPSKIVPFIPPQVDELLARSLKEDPNQRVQSIDEFWSVLGKIEPLKEQPRPKHI